MAAMVRKQVRGRRRCSLRLCTKACLSKAGNKPMKRKMLLLSFAGAVLLFSTMAYSHHSLAATYNSTAEIKLEGKLVQFVFRNPHSFVHLETHNANGEAERWAVEWTGVAALTRSGVQGDTLKPGDQV